MKKTIMAIVLAGTMLSACNPLSIINKSSSEAPAETTGGVTTTDISNLVDGKYYVKNGDTFENTYVPKTNILSENAIVSSSDPTRIFMLHGDEEKIPVLYRDDQLAFYTTSDIPTSFTWERFMDNGFSGGMYGITTNEGGKGVYEIGKSNTDPDSSAGKSMTNITVPEGTTSFIINKSGNVMVTKDTLSEAGTITGLKKGDDATMECYIGTKPFTIPAVADTQIFSSMSLTKSSEYELESDGYASITIPEDLLSGYYLINGKGLVKFVNANRADGMDGVDFNLTYYYKDEKGNTYSYRQYQDNKELLEAEKKEKEKEIKEETKEETVEDTTESTSEETSVSEEAAE